MDRTSIIVVSICAVLLVIFFPTQPPAPVQTTPQTQTSTVTDPTANQVDSATEPQAPVTTEVVNTTLDAEKLAPVALTTADENGETVAAFTFDPAQKALTKVELDRFLDNDQKNPVEFIAPSGLSFETLNSGVKLELIDVNSTAQSLSRSFVDKTTGAKFVETWTQTEASPYQLDYKLTITNPGTAAAAIGDIQLITFPISALEAKKGGMLSAQAQDNSTAAIWFQKADDLESYDFDDIRDLKDDNESRLNETIGWIGTQNLYFANIITPKVPFDGALLDLDDSTKGRTYVRTGGIYNDIDLGAGETETFQANIYIGPKGVRELQALGESQSDLLTPGVTGFLSKYLLRFMVFLNESGFSFGLAIITITIIIKALFWHLTTKSQVSMKKMAKLQPLMKELQSKYKETPQVMQQKTMELYREHKVNPVAGCLPMLIQLPVFFALFTTFRSAVELRHTSFLWASNLAAADTIWTIPGLGLGINPLAITMGVTMYLQQALSPTPAGDATQQKIIKYLPVIMLVVMYNMPSALTLYWTVNQLISIVQTLYVNRQLRAQNLI